MENIQTFFIQEWNLYNLDKLFNVDIQSMWYKYM